MRFWGSWGGPQGQTAPARLAANVAPHTSYHHYYESLLPPACRCQPSLQFAISAGSSESTNKITRAVSPGCMRSAACRSCFKWQDVSLAKCKGAAWESNRVLARRQRKLKPLLVLLMRKLPVCGVQEGQCLNRRFGGLHPKGPSFRKLPAAVLRPWEHPALSSSPDVTATKQTPLLFGFLLVSCKGRHSREQWPQTPDPCWTLVKEYHHLPASPSVSWDFG